jgi:hypothetical protein
MARAFHIGSAVQARDLRDHGRMDDPGTFTSELTLRRGWWRQFPQEAVAVAWSLGTAGASWTVWWRWDRAVELLVIAALLSGWCLYAGASWVRRGLRRLRLFRSGIPTLVLDDLGARVRHPFGNLDGAYLAWAECAAVVVSRPPSAGRVPDSFRAYVELVPLAPDRVEGAPSRTDQRTAILDRSPEEVRMVWLELTGVGRTAAEAAEWIRARRPGLTVVDSLGRQSARTE